MVTGVSSSVPTPLSILAQTRATGAAGATPSADTAASADSPAQRRAALLDQQMQNALQALRTLRQQGSSASDEAKSAARQKLEGLKARLKALMMLGGDPKARAKEAADIAKQIAAAAKAYADAGGDPGATVMPDAGAATPVVAPATSGEQGASGTSAPAAPTPDPTTAPTSALDGGASATASASPAAAASEQADPGAANQNPSSVVAAGRAVNAAPSPAKGGPSEMDQAFAREARSLVSQAIAIIHAAEQSLRLQHKVPDPTSAATGDAAVAAVVDAANTIGGPQLSGYAGAAATPATPAVSITV